jgi:flagellar basal-body rod modification protein FlgD
MSTAVTSPSFPNSPTLSSAATTAASSQTAGGNALSQLSGNYNNFLSLLMTQLRNQNPSSPMDANQFTQELVQFSSVEQQINTNSSLGQLIQITQQDGLLQASALVGKSVAVANSDMPVQNGQGAIQFDAPVAESVEITVSDANGNKLAATTASATQGLNTWTWNGKTSNGGVAPDGDYKVSVAGTAGAKTALAYNALGTVTGVQQNAGALTLQMGAVASSLSNVQQVLN